MTFPIKGIFRHNKQPVAATGAVGAKPAEQAQGGIAFAGQSYSSKNPFAGKTEGVNTNIGVGDTSNIPAQAGKKAGIGTTYAFA